MKSKTKIDALPLIALAFAMSVASPMWAVEGDQAAIASTAEAFVEAFDKGDHKPSPLSGHWTAIT